MITTKHFYIKHFIWTFNNKKQTKTKQKHNGSQGDIDMTEGEDWSLRNHSNYEEWPHSQLLYSGKKTMTGK